MSMDEAAKIIWALSKLGGGTIDEIEKAVRDLSLEDELEAVKIEKTLNEPQIQDR